MTEIENAVIVEPPEGPALGTDLERAPEILNPVTGELVKAADLPAVAGAIDLLRERRRMLDAAIAAFTAAAAAESVHRGTRTLHAGEWRVEVSPDTEVQWDVEVLQELRDAGLPEDRYLQLVTEVVEYKVDGRVAKQLEGASPVYAEIVGRARVRVPKKQYAQVKRA